MKNIGRNLTALWRYAFVAALLFAAAQWTAVSAQNPGAVIVEGNCFGGQTVAAPVLSCGDYDGDGRLGTAEDADPTDNVYGTIQGALEAIDHNGKVVIVTSGIFNENVYIGQESGATTPLGSLNPGNVTLEAAPGVEAAIDAFAQTGPAVAGNAARASSLGISVTYTNAAAIRLVTLRNLQVRNFTVGVGADNVSRVNIDKLRVENNINVGIRISNDAWADISRTHVTGTCSRVPAAACTLGFGIHANQNSFLRIYDSVVTHNAGLGVSVAAGASGRALDIDLHFNNGQPGNSQHAGLLIGNWPIFDN